MEESAQACMSICLSSEESTPECDDVFVKPIPWRSQLVNHFFEELDTKNLEKKTAQANRQRKIRKISMNDTDKSVPHVGSKQELTFPSKTIMSNNGRFCCYFVYLRCLQFAVLHDSIH